jgi:hypothetical protein
MYEHKVNRSDSVFSQTHTGKNLDPAVNDGKIDLNKQNTFLVKV